MAGRAVPALRARDDERTAGAGDVRRAVLRSVVDHDGAGPVGDPLEDPRQGTGLIEARQDDVELGRQWGNSVELGGHRTKGMGGRARQFLRSGDGGRDSRSNATSRAHDPYHDRHGARAGGSTTTTPWLRSLVSYLERAGHSAKHVADGLQAVDAVSTAVPDLMVLDLMLPGIDGLEVCKRVRADRPDLPVIMLTALAEPDDRISGLEVGADDYVTKPFSPRELVLRVRVRAYAAPAARPATASASVLTAGDITLDTAARRATKSGEELALTIRELDLLAFLMANPGQAFKRSQLMREVWGLDVSATSRRSPCTSVGCGRKVETDPTNPTLIQTVWGIGYRLELPAAG